jgi:hypothetical protein
MFNPLDVVHGSRFRDEENISDDRDVDPYLGVS